MNKYFVGADIIRPPLYRLFCYIYKTLFAIKYLSLLTVARLPLRDSLQKILSYNTSQIPGASVRQLRPALHLASFPICSLYLDPDTRLAGGFQTGFPDCRDPDRLRIRHRSVFIFVICYLPDQLLQKLHCRSNILFRRISHFSFHCQKAVIADFIQRF